MVGSALYHLGLLVRRLTDDSTLTILGADGYWLF